MAEIAKDAKLKLQMTMNPKTNEMEILITPKGAEKEHGWFFMRADLVNLLSHGKVTVPHAVLAEDAPKIQVVSEMPGTDKKP